MLSVPCLCLTLASFTQSDELVPAGSVNAAIAGRPVAFVVEDESRIVRQARAVRQQLFAGARWVDAKDAVDADLSGHTLLVYGTPTGNEWLAHHRDDLPFRFGKNTVDVQEHHFEGRDLRVICVVRNPQDASRRAVIYTGARAQDLVEINRIFHGPDEWLVADGRRVLGSGSFTTTRPLSAEAMQADLDFLLEKIEAVHPATLEGRTAALQEAVEFADTELMEPLSRPAFWFVANEVILSLHDAHSNLGKAPSAGAPIDLPVIWLCDGLVVTRDTGVLRRGDQVVSIGGHDEDAVLEALCRLIPAETRNWVRFQAPGFLTDLDVLVQLDLVEERGPVPVVVQRDGREVHRSLKPGQVTPAPVEEARNWVHWEFDEERSLGVFTLDQCPWNDQYRTAVHRFFQEVHDQGIRRVAVDLRRNGGGNSSVVNEFLRYLDVDEYADYSAAIRTSRESLAQRGGNDEPGYVVYGAQRKRNERVEDLPSFEGQLYVLTAPNTFSAANWFATVIQDNAIGTIVGEATGNAPSAYGDILRFTLPESGYAFTLSYKQFVRPDRSLDPAGCITPDVEVPLTAEAFLAGQDPVLEYLRGLEPPENR